MSTPKTKNGNERDFDAKIDTLRSTLRKMLYEVNTEAQPVQIDPDRGIDYYEKVEQFEVRLIESALELAGGRQNRAAELLHLPASTLSTKMKQFNIRRNGNYAEVLQ